MCAGVPQGLVLGLILWNIGYDWVLRGGTLREIKVLGYADDTLVLAQQRTYREAAVNATQRPEWPKSWAASGGSV